MNDQIDPSSGGAPAESPAAPAGSVDFDKFKTDLLDSVNKANDERFQGWQKTLSKRDEKLSKLEQVLEELKASTLSESEREQLTARGEQQELAALRAQNEVLRLATEYPEEVSLYQRILEAPTAKDQVEILREFKAQLAEAAKPKGDQEQPTGEPDNSQTTPSANPQVPEGIERRFEQDPTLADKVLSGFKRWRDQES